MAELPYRSKINIRYDCCGVRKTYTVIDGPMICPVCGRGAKYTCWNCRSRFDPIAQEAILCGFCRHWVCPVCGSCKKGCRAKREVAWPKRSSNLTGR